MLHGFGSRSPQRTKLMKIRLPPSCSQVCQQMRPLGAKRNMRRSRSASLRAAAARSAEARTEGPKMVSHDLVPHGGRMRQLGEHRQAASAALFNAMIARGDDVAP